MSASAFAEPVTPRGVAAFAGAKFRWLFLLQMIVALLGTLTVICFLHGSCFPVIRAAIQKLPAAGEIHDGELDWRGSQPQMLAEGNFLAIDVDLDHSGQIRSTTADVQIEFGRDSIRILSLLGYVELFYPPDRFAPFNRPELEPLWGAWSAEILFIAAAATFLGLLLSWWLLATIYFMPVWLLGFFTNRSLNFRASWKLSAAALLPGALLLTAGILLYDFGFLKLVSFGFVFAAHFVLGWIYAFVSLLFVPRISQKSQRENPFQQAKA